MICAIRELNGHPETVFTVLTGEGRFFSAGADVRGELGQVIVSVAVHVPANIKKIGPSC